MPRIARAHRLLIAIFSVVVIGVGLVRTHQQALIEDTPDFSAIEDIQERKTAFFETLLPLIAEQNTLIENQRAWLIYHYDDIVSQSTTSTIESKLTQLASEYGLPFDDDFNTQTWLNQLLTRVDVIPPALVLAQAANESGWGTSRFAQLGNNYFGQWCYSEGCGIIPASRAETDNHEVKKYDSIDQSLDDYFLNLNRNSAYQMFRTIRSNLRNENASLISQQAALLMSEGLIEYSQRRDEYVALIKVIINANHSIINAIEKSYDK